MESEAIYLAGNELNGYIAAYAILMIFFIAKPELTMAYTAPWVSSLKEGSTFGLQVRHFFSSTIPDWRMTSNRDLSTKAAMKKNQLEAKDPKKPKKKAKDHFPEPNSGNGFT